VAQVGIEVKFKAMAYPILLCPTSIPELTSLTVTPTGLRVGAAVTLARIEEWVEQREHGAEEKRRVELRPLVVSTCLYK
jgi:xanthine dehydrogenase/oxidase